MHSNTHLGVSLAAMLHAAGAAEGDLHACDTHRPWQTEDIISVPHKFVDGALGVPDEPGLASNSTRTPWQSSTSAGWTCPTCGSATMSPPCANSNQSGRYPLPHAGNGPRWRAHYSSCSPPPDSLAKGPLAAGSELSPGRSMNRPRHNDRQKPSSYWRKFLAAILKQSFPASFCGRIHIS